MLPEHIQQLTENEMMMVLCCSEDPIPRRHSSRSIRAHTIVHLFTSPHSFSIETECTIQSRLQKRPSPPPSIDLITSHHRETNNTPIKYIITRNVDIDKSKYLPRMPMPRLNHLVISSLDSSTSKRALGPRRHRELRRRRFLKGPRVQFRGDTE